VPVIDLSHVLSTGMDRYPGDDEVRIIPVLSHAEDGHQSSRLDMGCHVGTHIDTPLHFRDGEPGLDALPPSACMGAASVLDAPQGAIPAEILAGVDLGPLDFLILRTGWERHWGTPQYYADWPYLAPGTAELLATAGLKGVGLDTPSLDPRDGRFAHDLFAAAGMINVENLANLGSLPVGLFEFQALPLKIAGAEASPVRAIALT